MEHPTAVCGWSFSTSQLDRVEDDFAMLLEDCRWRSDELCLHPSLVTSKLRQRGHSHARINAMLDRLAERGVLERRCHPAKRVVDFHPEMYFVARERWVQYQKERQAERVIKGPIFTNQDWRRAFDAIDNCLQQYVWQDGENKIRLDSLYSALNARGLTRAMIDALLNLLVDEGVFRPWSHTVPTGRYREPGSPLHVVRLVSETTHCMITTREKWYAYISGVQRDSRLDESENRHGVQAITSELTDDATAELPVLAEDSAAKIKALTEEKSSEAPAPADRESFANFSVKQRKLLEVLQRKKTVDLAEVKNAVYETSDVQTGTLEQLVIRANRRLSQSNHRLEIKRKANTFSLQPL